MALGLLIKGRGDHFRFDRPSHVGYFFWTLINQKNHEVYLGMVLSNCVCNLLQEHGLTCFRLRYNHSALTLSNGGKQVKNSCRIAICLGRKI